MACTRRFSHTRRKKTVRTKHLWRGYVFAKQTVRELAVSHEMDKRIIREQLNAYHPPKKIHHPRAIHITVDATYFGERKQDSSWCVAVARDPQKKENLVWRFGQIERTSLYSDLKNQLEEHGYTIQSVTGDGFSGIRTAFRGIPYQMCHVHMERIVVRGTTRNPQTEAGQVILALVKTLHNTHKKTFNRRLTQYIEKYRKFLNEKTTNPLTGETYWTHKELRRASLSLIHHKQYLFTYTKNKNIPRTTNSLEGHFSHLKDIVGVHRGLSRSHKTNVINTILLASTIAPTEETLDKIL